MKLIELSKCKIVAFQQKDISVKQPQTVTEEEIDTFCNLVSQGNILEAQNAAPLVRQLTDPLSSQEIIQLRDRLAEFSNNICTAMTVRVFSHKKTEAFDYLKSYLEKIGEEVTFRVDPPNNRLYKLSLEGDNISINWKNHNLTLLLNRDSISNKDYKEHLGPIVVSLKQRSDQMFE